MMEWNALHSRNIKSLKIDNKHVLHHVLSSENIFELCIYLYLYGHSENSTSKFEKVYRKYVFVHKIEHKLIVYEDIYSDMSVAERTAIQNTIFLLDMSLCYNSFEIKYTLLTLKYFILCGDINLIQPLLNQKN